MFVNNIGKQVSYPLLTNKKGDYFLYRQKKVYVDDFDTYGLYTNLRQYVYPIYQMINGIKRKIGKEISLIKVDKKNNRITVIIDPVSIYR